ncbi:hypothetical protein BEN49_09545 [Hymenobacter coccineus]|uniref:DUF2975 domain-containing protein n=1 Tax=Hymenobacter coccineus TaxID=1908235 RepID=A0A1G1TE88_9BACT|nr:hypothetical protein BEN49_09545 [Hymenobacter coccineus]
MNINTFLLIFNKNVFLCWWQLTLFLMATMLKSLGSLKSFFILSRVLTGIFLFAAFGSLCGLIGKTYDSATGSPEVRLVLYTTTPNLFSAAHDMNAGFEDGFAGRPHRPERGPLPGLRASAESFELAADPNTPLLRYREPNAWKRVALLYLGAADSYLSLSWVILISVGSWLLWGLLRDVTPETPFTRANAQRLVRLVLLVLLLSQAQHLAYLALRALVPAFHAPGVADTLNHYVRLNTDDSIPNPLLGVMLAVIAIVYRRGVELSQEVELVI